MSRFYYRYVESQIKDYILSHNEVTKYSLVKHIRSSYDTVTFCLNEAGICLMPKRWQNENRILKEGIAMIKDYILSHNEVSTRSLVEHTGYSHSNVKACLNKAGICLMPKKWHAENRVLQEYNRGVGIEEIGKNLNLTPHYVSSILVDFGKIPGSSLERKFLASYEQGNHSSRELALDLDISGDKAHKLKKKFGLPPGKRKPRSGSYTLRDNLLRQGLSQYEVSRAEGVSRVTIGGYLHRNPQLRKEWKAAKKIRKAQDKL